MSDLVLRSDPYDAEYPSLVKEMLAQAASNAQLYAQITKDGFCTVIYSKYLYVWSYDTEDTNMPHAFKVSMPSTGLPYTSAQVCVYKKGLAKMPSILCVSPEGTLRHWSAADKPYKDTNLELNNEVAHSLIVIDEQNHVHRFVLSTTTGSFFIIEVFHDENSKEHLVTRSLDLTANISVHRRMTAVLFGHAAVSKEDVVRLLPVAPDQMSEGDAEFLALFHKAIRIYSITGSRMIHEISVSDVVGEGLQRIGMNAPRDLKYHLLDAIIYRDGILMAISLNFPPTQKLDFYLAYISTESAKTRRKVKSFYKIDVPDHLAILSPFHESSLPVVTLHVPNENECAVVFPKFVLLISNVTEDEKNIIREEFDDILLGVAIRNGFCHLILKESGICTLRRLPRLFDLSFWKKHKANLLKPTGDFFGRDFELLQRAFFTFCAKDLDKASELAGRFSAQSDLEFSNVVVLFLRRFLNSAPPNDPRWTTTSSEASQNGSDKVVVILSQLREKLSFYRMFFLFLCNVNLLKKLDVSLSDQGERTARTLLVEFGEKLLAMLDCFDWVAQNEYPVVRTAISQLSRRFTSQFDHSTNRHLTIFDHFFKEVSAFEEFIPELVKCENEQLEQCSRVYKKEAAVVSEIGAALMKIAEALKSARSADWSTKPTTGALTWINQPRSMKYFIQHLNMALALLGRQQTIDNDKAQQTQAEILKSTECLARLILGEQDQCQRNNSQIIAKFYEIGQKDIALQLANDFEDFTMLIRHSHAVHTDEERHAYLEALKEKFKERNFDICLYEFYRKNNMVEFLLEERGDRLDSFLANHENIAWIRSIESSMYGKARGLLKNLIFGAKTADKKATIAALAKMCALCEDNVDHEEVAFLTSILTLIEHQESIDKTIAKRVNPTNRPLTAREIIDADLEENAPAGFMKALLVVATLISSAVEEFPEKEARTYVKHIFKAILASDKWKTFDATNSERFKLQAAQTALSSVLLKLFEMDLAEDIKEMLLPTVKELPQLITLDERRMGQLRNYLTAELASLKFCAENRDERMEL